MFDLIEGRNSQRINDANNYGDNRGIWIAENLASTVAFSVDQHGIANAGMAVIQSDEVAAGILAGKHKRLYDKQAAIFKRRVAKRGDNRAGNFADDH